MEKSSRTHSPLDAYVDQLVDDLRSDHPGIVEEWERQREDAFEHDEPAEDWPDYNTATGLLWWLRSEIDLSVELGRQDDTGRETAIGHYCIAAIEDLQRAATVPSRHVICYHGIRA